jgi:hypothetical protein
MIQDDVVPQHQTQFADDGYDTSNWDEYDTDTISFQTKVLISRHFDEWQDC